MIVCEKRVIYLIFILYNWISSIRAHLVESNLKRGLLIIPGLGRTDRLSTVVHNLRKLEPYLLQNNHSSYTSKWDCLVYIYASRLDPTNNDFFNQTEKLKFVQSLCQIIEYPKKLVAENLFNVEPYLIQHSHKYVFILLDDCKLPSNADDFNLHKILAIMNFNKLTVATPLVIGANKGGGQHFRKIMQLPAPSGTIGHSSTFVEIFSWIMTIDAYKALWELFCPHVNPYAWGYDIWYDRYAKKRVPGHKMGIISTMKVFHEQDFSAPDGGRSDNTDMKIKWKAMKAQESYYRQHYNIKLHAFKVENKTWNGAATGFLYAPPE